MLPLPPFRHRTLAIVLSVLLLHALGLWGLQSGLLQRAAAAVEELVVPVSVITEPPVVPQAPPKPLPPALPTKAAPQLPSRPVAPATPAQAPQPAAMPQAIADTTPAANAAIGVSHAQSAPAVAAASPAPVSKAEPPSVEADYLVMPNREFPRRCLRRREQGTVVVHVLIGVDGHAEKAEIGSSSGFDCLNREALDTALSAQYKPVTRGGVAVQAWRDASFKYVLPE